MPAAYADAIEVFTAPGMELAMPVNARPEPKRRFVPSKWEHKKARYRISRLADVDRS